MNHTEMLDQYTDYFGRRAPHQRQAFSPSFLPWLLHISDVAQYNKDLQESVEPMLDHIKTVGDSVQIATGVLSTLAIQPSNMLKALTPDMLATDLADYLVRKGVPFRETHHISGKVVALSEEESTPMDKLSYEQLKSVDPRFEEDVVNIFDYQKSTEMRSTKGGTSRGAVEEQIMMLKKMLEEL